VGTRWERKKFTAIPTPARVSETPEEKKEMPMPGGHGGMGGF
jgi:hypothetical protein